MIIKLFYLNVKFECAQFTEIVRQLVIGRNKSRADVMVNSIFAFARIKNDISHLKYINPTFFIKMCVLFIYTDPSPNKDGYRLIIASNRDEYYIRPAKDAFHCDQHNIIGGRDMQEGREDGMWLGVSLNKTETYNFRFGCLLNVTGEERNEGVEGRGFIVPNYLKSDIQGEKYVETLSSTAELHNAYNFVAVELSVNAAVAYHQSNRPNSSKKFEGKQVLGFGNSTLTVPLQKVHNGRRKFEEIIITHSGKTKDTLVEALLELLRSEQRYLPDAELERRSSAYEYLCSIFVQFEAGVYGTRAHSLILVDNDWNVEFIEVAMQQPINPRNPTWATHKFKAQL